MIRLPTNPGCVEKHLTNFSAESTTMNKLSLPNYELTGPLTREQLELFDRNGAIIFRNFIPAETVKNFLSEITRIEKEWLAQGIEKVNGIPLKFGMDEAGNR